MTQPTQKQADGQGSRERAADTADKVKKPYRKPELTRYEQLHGIGLGSPD